VWIYQPQDYCPAHRPEFVFVHEDQPFFRRHFLPRAKSFKRNVADLIPIVWR